jgi:hypothetical protein
MLAVGCLFIVGGGRVISSGGVRSCRPGPDCSPPPPSDALWGRASGCSSWPGRAGRGDLRRRGHPAGRPARRAGDASDVVLTALVTLGAIGPAAVAAVITSLTPTGPERAYDLVLRAGGTVILASTALSLLVRRRLSARGLMPSS